MSNRRNLTAATLAVAMTLTGCSASSTEPAGLAAAAPAADPAAAPSTVTFEEREAIDTGVGFSDGYEHFVVLTAPDTAPDDTPDTAPETAPAGPVGDADTGGGADDLEVTVGLSGETIVHFAGTSTVVDISAGVLRGVTADGEAELAALVEHSDSVVVMLVEDLTGAIGGGIGARYVYTDDGLYPLDDTTPSTNTNATTDTATNTDTSAPDPDVTDRAVITNDSAVVGGATDIAVLAEIRQLDTTVEARLVGPGVISVTTDGDGSDLAGIAGVDSVQEEVTFELSADPLQRYQWMLDNTGAPAQALGSAGSPGVDIGAHAAWDVSTGAGVVVAVIDTGVQRDHPDLAGRLAVNPDEVCGNGLDDDANGFVDDCAGWDFGDSDADPSPDANAIDFDHGTHVAGIVAAGRNGVGVVGVAPDAQVMNLKVMGKDSVMKMSSVAVAVDYAVDNGADVVNMSLGTTPGAVPRAGVVGLETAISKAVAAGVIVVSSAGNATKDISDSDVWPASYSTFHPVITAGASTNQDQPAPFSNYGTPVSLWAPGAVVLSTFYGSEYGWMSGTSMAAPVIAGAAAALLASGSYTPAGMRTHLVNTSVASPAGPRLDLAAALGANSDAAVSVSYRGAHTMTSDTPGTLSIDVTADSATEAASMRVSVATRDQGDVAAVSGLSASISHPTGATESVTTGADGSFPTMALGAGVSSGVTFDSTMTLPTGDYAFVTELLSVSGARVGGVQVAYISVDETVTTITTTTLAQNPVTMPTTPTTTTPGGSGSPPTPAPTTTAPSSGGGGGGGGGGGDDPTTPTPTPTTTAPADGGSGSPITPAPTTTAPADGGSRSPATPTIPTRPAPTTTAPGGGDGSTTTPTTTAPGGGDGSTTPPTTTPPPDGDIKGNYSLQAMTPRRGRTAGFETVTLTGAFPDGVPVYVWFGDHGVREAHFNDGSTLQVYTPATNSAAVTDVLVKFRTNLTNYELVLDDAFTFYTPDKGITTTTTTTTTVPTRGGTPATTTSTVPTRGGTPASTTSTVPDRDGTSPPATVPSWSRSRSSLTLTPPAPGSTLALLSSAAWAAVGCQKSTCPATSL